MKKESAHRGYMTRSEINSHLEGVNSDKDRIKYLKTMLEKRQLLAPETEANVRELAAEIYMKHDQYDEAKEIIEKPQLSRKSQGFFRKNQKREMAELEKGGDFESAGALAERLGMRDKAKELYAKAVQEEKDKNPRWPNIHSYSSNGVDKFGAWRTHEGELLRKAGKIEEAKRFYDDLADNSLHYYEIHGRGYGYMESAIGYLKAAGQMDQARELEKEYFGKVSTTARGEFLKSVKEKRTTLENKVITVIFIVVAFGAGMLFTGSGLTGNVIGSLGKTSVSWFGFILLFITMAGFFWYSHDKKQ